MEKKLGKIIEASFGLGGYQGSGIGLYLTFECNSWGVGFSKTYHNPMQIKHTENCQWTEKDRSKSFDELVRYISKILDEAKVTDVSKLVGTPVEVEFDGNLLKDWRILTEVI